MKEVKQVIRRRRFSEEFKRSRVRDFERGKLTVYQISKEYDLHPQLVYNWIRKYSAYHKKGYQIVVEEKSLGKKNQELRSRIEELEAMLGRKQMKIEYLEKLIELSSEDLGVDLQKKGGTAPWNGSGSTKPNTGGQ